MINAAPLITCLSLLGIFAENIRDNFPFIISSFFSDPSKINFHEKKVGIGATPERGNFTITTKTNPYGKIITFLANHKHNPQRVV